MAVPGLAGYVERVRSPSRLARLRAKDAASVRYAIARRVNRLLYPFGFALLSDHFYQPLPPKAALVGHRQPCRRVEESVDDQAGRVRAMLGAVADELGGDGLGAFGYPSPMSQLPLVDAAVLYAMVRSEQPARVVEVGSGCSTRVIAAALHRNAEADGRPSRFVSIDPYVSPVLGTTLDPRVSYEHRKAPLQGVDPDTWTSLGAGDIVFVDSSHVFKAGSDVEVEFLGIYPVLQRGVLVHLHDVFLPLDYPLDWNLARSQFWNEQQFLAVMLDNSDRYEVVAGLAAVHDRDPRFFRALLPAFDCGYSPGSIWLRVAR